MTDNEIIKALECCYSNKANCNECHLWDCEGDCFEELMKYDVLSLINRQKAEIERLREKNKSLFAENVGITHSSKEIKAEAIKEFAERLKELPECQDVPAVLAVIDDLVKERVGDSDEN